MQMRDFGQRAINSLTAAASHSPGKLGNVRHREDTTSRHGIPTGLSRRNRQGPFVPPQYTSAGASLLCAICAAGIGNRGFLLLTPTVLAYHLAPARRLTKRKKSDIHLTYTLRMQIALYDG